ETLTSQKEAENRVSIPGGRMFSGAFAGGQLSLGYSGQRIDIVLGPQPTEPDPAAEKPTLASVGPWPAVAEEFANMITSWLPTVRFPVIRLGLGAVLLHQTDTREQAYEILDDCLVSVTLSDPVRMRDFIYRINWPLESSVQRGLSLNRITAWSAIR